MLYPNVDQQNLLTNEKMISLSEPNDLCGTRDEASLNTRFWQSPYIIPHSQHVIFKKPHLESTCYWSATARLESVSLNCYTLRDWDAVVRLTRIIYIESTLNFWAISSILKKCICGIRPFLKCLYRLRPINHCIVMKHLRTFDLLFFYGKNELWDMILVYLSDVPLTCQCSKTSLIDLILSATWK